jgi:hypothetical protein
MVRELVDPDNDGANCMRKHTPKARLFVEELEIRVVPAGTITVPLDPVLDEFGDQVATVQAYGDTSRTTFGIFDTGASAVTFAPDDADLFAAEGVPIPIKVPGGAQAGGIGGDITGDVSEPGNIIADGMHVEDITFDNLGFPNFTANFDANSAQTPGIQAFVGTQDGSPDLPTITGTPILEPSSTNPSGLAARMDMQGASLDFGSFIPGLVLTMPDLHFVQPGTQLQGGTGITDPVYIPMGTFGSDNYADPGDSITESVSPIQNNVSVFFTPTGGSTTEIDNNHFLLDTGSQLTVISTDLATSLGLDLNHPDTTIDVQGVGGTETIPGFTIDKLELPTTVPGTFVDFTNVDVFVIDVAPGVDGLLGTNLWDTADSLLYDPYNPAGASLGVTFFTDPNRGGGLDGGNANFLNSAGLNFFTDVMGAGTHMLPGVASTPTVPTASFAAPIPGMRATPVSSVNLTFNEAVTGLTVGNLQLTQDGNNIDLSGATLSTKDNIHWSIANLAGLEAGDGQYQLTLTASANVKDRAGHALTSGASTTWTLDATKPTVVISSPSQDIGQSGQSITYPVTYSDAHFAQSTLSQNNITLNKTGTASGSIAVSGTGATRTVTISNLKGDGTLGITLAAGTASDLAGNLADGTQPSATFVVDNTAPTVVIGGPSQGQVTDGASVQFQVTYSDANLATITLSAANIIVNAGGTAKAATIDVSGAGTTRTVTLGGITGLGSLGISLPAGTAVDQAGNPAIAAGPSDTVTVGASALTAAITAVDPDPRTLPVPTLTIVFSEAVTGVVARDFTLTRAGKPIALKGARVTTSDGVTWTLTLPTHLTTTPADYRVTLRAARSGIKDSAGNSLASDATVTWTHLLFADSFTRADSPTLGSSWVQRVGSFSISGNQALANAAINLATAKGITATESDQQISIALAATGTQTIGLVSRYTGNGADRSMYWADLTSVDGNVTAEIWRNVRGKWLRLASQSVAGGASILRFVTQGHSLQLYVDGQLTVSTTDTALRSGGIGMRGTQGVTVADYQAQR